MDDRYNGELITSVSNKERMAQFAVAIIMLFVGLVAFRWGMTGSTAATVGGSAFAFVCGLGAIVLAQDRKQP